MHAAYADPVAAISLEMQRYAKKLLRTKTRSRLLKTPTERPFWEFRLTRLCSKRRLIARFVCSSKKCSTFSPAASILAPHHRISVLLLFPTQDIVHIITQLILNAAPSSDQFVRRKRYARGLVLWAATLALHSVPSLNESLQTNRLRRGCSSLRPKPKGTTNPTRGYRLMLDNNVSPKKLSRSESGHPRPAKSHENVPI